MSNTIETAGQIEVHTVTDPVSVGDRVGLIFTVEDDLKPPFKVRVWSPTGKLIVESILRELPTGRPQGAQPVAFTPAIPGAYKIDVQQVQGTQKGTATLHVQP